MAWRNHAPAGEPCWCNQTYPVEFKGVVIGQATPLEDGSYAIVFHPDDIAQEAQRIVNDGLLTGISINEPIQDELFTTEETQNDV